MVFAETHLSFVPKETERTAIMEVLIFIKSE